MVYLFPVKCVGFYKNCKIILALVFCSVLQWLRFKGTGPLKVPGKVFEMAPYNKYSLRDVFVSRDRSKHGVGVRLACAYFASLVLQYGSPRNLNRSLEEMLELAAVSEECKSVIRENLADDWEKIVLQFGGCSQQECKSFFQQEVAKPFDDVLPSFWSEIILEFLSLKDGDRFAHFCFEEGNFLSKLLDGAPASLPVALPNMGEMTALTEMRMYVLCPQHKLEVIPQPQFKSGMWNGRFSKIFLGNINLYPFVEDSDANRSIIERRVEESVWANLNRALNFLKKGGVCAALVPEQALGYQNFQMPDCREKIFRENTIECILSLPKSAASGNKSGTRGFSTVPSAALVVIRKSAPKAAHKLMLVDAKTLSTEVVLDALRQRNTIGILKGLEENTQMISENQIKGNRNKFTFLFKHYQSLPWALTEGKTLRPLEEVADIVRGAVMSSSWRNAITDVQPSKAWARYATLADISVSGELTPSQYVLMDSLSERDKRSLVFAGTVIVARVGRPLKYAVVTLQKEEALFLGSNFYAVKCKENELDPYYFSLFLGTPLGMASIEKILIGDALPSISIADLKSLQVSCPPIEEQRKLAAQYKKILSTIEEKQKEIESCRQALKELAETL